MKKVAADTVTELTAASGFPGAPTAPPSTQELIDKIQADLALKTKALAQRARENPSSLLLPPSAFEISLLGAMQDIEDFENILKNVPQGFKLVPVLYSKVKQEQNEDVRSEYSRRVRRNFIQHLGKNHAAELRALGICDHGIERMKQGHDPTDAAGNHYAVNTDHIIERAGGGQMSLKKEIDPMLPPGSPPTYPSNHINNLILLPLQVHEFKNKLNSVQEAAKTPNGQSKWVLMMVPETGPGMSGFVCPPQPAGHQLHGLHMAKQAATHQANQISQTAKRAQKAIHILRSDKNTQSLLKDMERQAALENKTVADFLHEENSLPVPPQKTLSTAFNAAVAAHPDQKTFVEITLKPAIEELTLQLRTAFNEATKPGRSRGMVEYFSGFYNGRNFKALRRELEKLPLEEAVEFNETVKQIDQTLRSRFNITAPVNDNKPQKSQKKRQKGKRRQRHNSHKQRGGANKRRWN